MKLLDYLKACDLDTKSLSEKAKYLSYYHYKETGTKTYNMAVISELLINANYNKPNSSRLKESLIKGKNKIFINSKVTKGELEFIPAVLQELDASIGKIWSDTITIISDSELIDEIKFCGKRDYLTKLIKQINSSYKNNCYDACAVLMRRLFEILLILSYQNNQIDNLIKAPDGNYFMLEKIAINAKTNNTLNLSRNKNKYDSIREVGNNSAHSITYTAGKHDIDDIKRDYRLMLDELYNKAGLI